MITGLLSTKRPATCFKVRSWRSVALTLRVVFHSNKVVLDSLAVSIFCYWAGDVRKLIKDGQLTDEQIVKALCQFPTELQDLSEALSKTLELLANRKTNPGYDLYASMLGEVSEQFRRLVEATGNNRVFELLHVEDQVAGKFGGPVYVNSINHATKRITIGFRGSVTTKDFLCDWKTALAKIANPLAGEQRSGGDFIHVHHGFKEYLYDPVVETENEEGVLEKQPLIAHMLSRVAKLFEEYPDYHLYTTGHSLGGALATLFEMEAGASKDPRIKKPVTCITFASPRVGNLSFGRVFKVGLFHTFLVSTHSSLLLTRHHLHIRTSRKVAEFDAFVSSMMTI